MIRNSDDNHKRRIRKKEEAKLIKIVSRHQRTVILTCVKACHSYRGKQSVYPPRVMEY